MKTEIARQELIYIDSTVSTPKYRQIVEAVQKSIAEGLLSQGDPIPSVNYIAERFSIARGSIFKAYNLLRGLGIIDSIPGKGYFVINTKPVGKKNIFLLMSTFNPYREVFYNSFVNRIKKQATVDVYFHHHNINVFETLINNHASYYNTFIIMPEIHKKTKDILKRLDQRNLYILDTGLEMFKKQYPCVCQNYSRDIYTFLESSKKHLKRYKRVVLLFSGNMRNYDLIQGFESFFTTQKMEGVVIRQTEDFMPSLKDICIVMDDNDLVRLILFAKGKQWQLGDHLGVVSYNETPLKSIIDQGITTISPDFKQMGISMADMILEDRKDYIENPFLVTERGSY